MVQPSKDPTNRTSEAELGQTTQVVRRRCKALRPLSILFCFSSIFFCASLQICWRMRHVQGRKETSKAHVARYTGITLTWLQVSSSLLIPPTLHVLTAICPWLSWSHFPGTPKHQKAYASPWRFHDPEEHIRGTIKIKINHTLSKKVETQLILCEHMK